MTTCCESCRGPRFLREADERTAIAQPSPRDGDASQSLAASRADSRRRRPASGWLPTGLDPELVFQDDQQRTWREAIRAIGGEVAGMEDLPPDVSWN